MKLSGTLKRTLSLYGAQIFNLLLGWAIAKFNVSYLTVAEYGQFTFFITVVNSIFIFFTFGIFESSSRLIALSENDADYRKLLAGSITLAFFSYLVFTAVLFFSRGVLDRVFSVEISHLIEVFFPLAGIYLFYDLWQKNLRGAEKIYQLSWLVTGPRLIYLLSIILLILSNHFNLYSSLFTNLLSLLLIVLYFFFVNKPDFTLLTSSLKKIRSELRTFGIHMYWGELINAFLYQVDKLLIAFFLDAEQLAYYSLAFTITLPLSLFSTSLSTSLYRRFSQVRKIDKKVLYLNLFWVVLSISVFVVLRKWIILHLFSQKYMESLQVFVFLAIAFGIGGISKIFTYFLMARGAGKIIKNIAIITLSIDLILNIVLIPKHGILGSAIARLISHFFDLIFLIFYYYKSIRINTLIN